MNTKDIKDIHDVKIVIGGMEDKLTESASDVKIIKHCLLGNPEDNNDLGLVGDVRNNKRWRNTVNKLLGGTVTLSLGLAIKEFLGYIKKG